MVNLSILDNLSYAATHCSHCPGNINIRTLVGISSATASAFSKKFISINCECQEIDAYCKNGANSFQYLIGNYVYFYDMDI
jgi:hypothetical protein